MIIVCPFCKEDVVVERAGITVISFRQMSADAVCSNCGSKVSARILAK